MTLDQVMKALEAKGSASTKSLWLKHGAKEPFFGVKVADLKALQKNIKGEQALALELYGTGNGDAQYLAGLVVNGAHMTPGQLKKWAKEASWCMISNFSVPWAASEHSDGLALALEWIDSPTELVASAGWRTLGALVTIRPDSEIPTKRFVALLDRCAKTITKAPDEVRLSMNAFIISCGTYSANLGESAIATARKIGKVEADMGDTACKISEAESSILKARRGAPAAPKRKSVRC